MPTEDHAKPGTPKFTVTHAFGYGYAVLDPDGARISDFTSDRGKAVRLMKQKQHFADTAAKRIERPCLCCGHKFKSEGIHNRMCGPCRGRGDSDLAPAQVGSMSGLRRSA